MKRLVRSAWSAGLALFVAGLMIQTAHAQTVGESTVSFLNGQLDQRLGGGSSSHMATEALRVAGGEFCSEDLGDDYPSSGDKVWGTLVAVIRCVDGDWSDSNSSNPCLPGDVLQFGGPAVVADVEYSSTFTAVVRTVNGSNRPATVFRQNFNHVRKVESASIDLNQLSNGWVRIYRPKVRTDVLGVWKFTVVNNSTSSLTYTVMVDTTTVSTQTATAAGTWGSYFVYKVTTDGTVACVVQDDNTIYVETAKGNEIYNRSEGGLGLRQVVK